MRWLAVLACPAVLLAHDTITTRITWSKEISRIVFQRCAGCHRDGGKTPMSLLTYGDVRPWAKAIKEEVLQRRMPPWGAVKGFGEFRNEAALTQEELSLIADWVEGGAPEGEAAFLPPPPATPSRSATEGAKQAGPVVSRPLTLTAPLLLAGLRPVDIAPDASARILARRPDGRVYPLLWLLRYKTSWNRTFEFKEPLALPAGTTLEVFPAGVARIELLTATPSPEH